MSKNIFLIAGEASGDALGAKLIAALKSLHPDIKLSGIGGEKMQKLGLKSLFPMEELSLLGFAEIIPHIPHLLKRITETADHIEEIRPDIVVTIDAPAFNFRVARKLKERNSKIKLVHYVAPSVWAYKPKRAEKIAALYDHLLTILPFEPEYFEKVGLPATFVGHSIVEENLSGGSRESFRQKHGIYKNAPVVYVMPGSRKSEIKRLLPVFFSTLEIMHEAFPDLVAVILATDAHKSEIKTKFSVSPFKSVVINSTEKRDALAASDVGLVKSGTGTLELAIAGVPMVVAYKVNPISAFALRKMIMVPYVNIVNLLLNAPVIPEMLQEDCNPEYLSAALSSLLENKDERTNQLVNTQKAIQMLKCNTHITPSAKAASVISELI